MIVVVPVLNSDKSKLRREEGFLGSQFEGTHSGGRNKKQKRGGGGGLSPRSHFTAAENQRSRRLIPAKLLFYH